MLIRNVYGFLISVDLHSLFSTGAVLGVTFGIQMMTGLLLTMLFVTSLTDVTAALTTLTDTPGDPYLRSLHIAGTSGV